MLESALFYVGLVAALLGGISAIRPLRFLGIAARRSGGLVAAVGAAVSVAALALPARETRISGVTTRLDEFIPVYQFHERHSLQIRAPRERVDRAIRQVTANDIVLFRTLTWIRRFGRSGAESILNAPPDRPILDVATRTGFLLLSDQPGREIVIGMAVLRPRGRQPSTAAGPEGFKAIQEPGFALAAMNFRLEERVDGGCLLVTETRIFATDGSARRKFARYWRAIYPGSSLLRFMWLRAIKVKAESSGTGRR